MNGLSEEIFESDYEADYEGQFSDMEGDYEGGDYEAGDYEAGDYESDYESDQEWGYQGEGEAGFGEGEGPFSEEQEIEMAAELLSVSEEGELDQFLGKLIHRAGRAAGKFIRSPTGKALAGLFRKAAKQFLPIAGRAVGTYFGGPVGGAVGSQVATTGGQIFGLELEGMSGEDQELQVAKHFVRLAGEAAANAAQAPSDLPPQQAARAALAAAARQHAPGLLRNGGAVPGAGWGGAGKSAGLGGQRRQSGRWIRRGNKIVLLGV